MEEIPSTLEEMIYELELELEGGFIWGSILFRNLLLMPVFCLVGALIIRVFINKNREETV